MLEVNNVTKKFGGLIVLSNINIRVEKGEICGLIGPNGAGKTTLYNIITRNLNPTSGNLTFMGRDITKLKPHRVNHLGISRTFQVVRPFKNLCVFENILVASFHGRNNGRPLKKCKEETVKIMNFMGLSEYKDVVSDDLPTPKLRSLELARAIVQNPILLLLDEVIAGLTPREKKEILVKIRELNSKGMTIVIVEHDMQAIMSISKRIIVLSEGRIIATGTPEAIRNDKSVIKAYLGDEYAENK